MPYGLPKVQVSCIFTKKVGHRGRSTFVGLAYQGNGYVFRIIIEYSSLRDFFGPEVIGLFLHEEI